MARVARESAIMFLVFCASCVALLIGGCSAVMGKGGVVGLLVFSFLLSVVLLVVFHFSGLSVWMAIAVYVAAIVSINAGWFLIVLLRHRQRVATFVRSRFLSRIE